ncbi:hypothetical protein F2Q69_00026733 [Brassica cretica]|uniref:Uncharacterized protein n=1 Tax=Brassica cretica TaxID=69181 RepID=A0A8S9RZJ6_BRACR|nr:hypothetical protein F2Q69_00026733 [Brassica cretica]
MITVLSGRLKRKMNLDKKEEPTNVFAGLEIEVTKTVLSVIKKRVDMSYQVMIAFAVSGYASTEGRQCKPFNPPLGETLIHTLVITHQSFINIRGEDPRTVSGGRRGETATDGDDERKDAPDRRKCDGGRWRRGRVVRRR